MAKKVKQTQLTEEQLKSFAEKMGGGNPIDYLGTTFGEYRKNLEAQGKKVRELLQDFIKTVVKIHPEMKNSDPTILRYCGSGDSGGFEGIEQDGDCPEYIRDWMENNAEGIEQVFDGMEDYNNEGCTGTVTFDWKTGKIGRKLDAYVEATENIIDD